MITTDRKISFQQLSKLPAPKKPANAGEYWVGVKHSELLREICNACTRKGWECTLREIALSNDKADMVATFSILCSFGPGEFELGVITSNARRHALKFFPGFYSKEHKFGTVLGEVFVGQKREGASEEFNLSARLDEALEEVERLAGAISGLLSLWALAELSARAVDSLLCDIGRKGILPWSRLGKMAFELNTEAQKGDDAVPLFAAFSAFSDVVRESPPLSQLDQLNEFRKLIHSRVPEMAD